MKKLKKSYSDTIALMQGKEADYIDFTENLMFLAQGIIDFEGESENIWYIGEGLEFTLDDLIVGAYWHYAEFHNGQNSIGYEALSVLGEIFSPNMSSLDEERSEFYVYELLEQLESKNRKG